MFKFLVILIVSLVQVQGCYWNRQCPYDFFGPKTPYEIVRGDIRDFAKPENCEAISIWTLSRHGNMNPSPRTTKEMKNMAALKDEIISSYEAGTSQLCAQDIETLRKWKWNSTLEHSQYLLTGTGYEEQYNIGRRIREKYPHLLQGDPDQFYIRPEKEQRAVTSCMAYVHGLTDGHNLNVTVDDPWERDDVIMPYKYCDRYIKTVRGGTVWIRQKEIYYASSDYIAVQNAVQQRLGINTPLDAHNVFSIYELCRNFRSWTDTLRSPWCAAFSDEDLLVLEYYDDLRKHITCGYGSEINVKLGRTPLKDLYEKLEAAVNGKGKKIVSYFSHGTMLQMTYTAMGFISRDDASIQITARNPDRKWRTSFIGPFSTNLIAVLNRCNESGESTHRVQLFVNEKNTHICPLKGCPWEEFQEKFRRFTESYLDFCSMESES